MTDSEDNKHKIHTLFDRILNQNDLELLDDLIAPGYTDHSPVPGQLRGADGIRNKLKSIRAAFPDICFFLEEIISQEDLVAVRYHWEATHEGPFGAVPATGKKVSVKGMDFYRFDGGKITEHWDCVDELALLRQMGVITD